ncbi:TPA: hypothetical protein ACQFLB_003451, partial [Proteus mirabilis]
ELIGFDIFKYIDIKFIFSNNRKRSVKTFTLRRLILLYKQISKKTNDNVDYNAIKVQKNELLLRFQQAKKKAEQDSQLLVK